VASPVRGVFVGTLAQLYKAPDVLLEAIRIAVNGGIEIDLTIVGDGQHRPKLEQASREMGVGQVVHFLGHLPAGDSVRQQLDAADLFILPSRQEGLPRAMIEAMARALPCIGTKVGGIPELLEPEDLVEPNDAAALAAKIVEVIKNPERLSQMSARNLTKANEFRDETLQERRTEFYAHIRESTCTWIRTRGTAT
jgi:glycosyltransferase involved in cell wall biosynthesis